MTGTGSVSTDTYFAGQHGLREKFYDSRTYANHDTYQNGAISAEKLMTSFEIPYGNKVHTAIKKGRHYLAEEAESLQKIKC